MRLLTILALLLLIPAGALGATLTGTAYTQNLAVAQYAILTINTTPEQQVVLEDGAYNLTVPPGTYLLRASLRQSGQRYEDEVIVRAVDDGTYAYDLILFRVEQEDPTAQDADPTDGLEFPDDTAPDISNSSWRAYALGALVLAALIALALTLGPRTWWRQKHKATSTADASTKTPEATPSGGLPTDLTETLAALKAEGGRVTQKDLRKRLPYSEAKVSMMLADLESRGLVKRIKQGRANLIVLK